MFKQFQVSENKLREKAIFNSYCYKKVHQLKQKLRTLLLKLKQNEKEQKEMSENLGNAYSTIDSLELLNKTEDALKYDIRTLMKQKNQIDNNETFISRSIIGSTFEAKIKEEFVSNNKKMIKPLIKGSAFITGKQELYVTKDDPFPEGYRLNDTWPDF